MKSLLPPVVESKAPSSSFWSRFVFSWKHPRLFGEGNVRSIDLLKNVQRAFYPSAFLLFCFLLLNLFYTVFERCVFRKQKTTPASTSLNSANSRCLFVEALKLPIRTRSYKKCNSDTVSRLNPKKSFLFAGSLSIVMIILAVQTLYCHIVFQY